MTHQHGKSRTELTRRGLIAAGGALGLAGLSGLAAGAAPIGNVFGSGTPESTPMTEAGSDADVTQVVRIEYVGGLTMPEARLLTMPFYVLASDGTQIEQGIQTAIFPPAALPALVESTLTQEGVDAVLAAAEEAGLTGEDAEYRSMYVADAPELHITVTHEGRTTTTIAYGLDSLPADSDPELHDAWARIQGFTAYISTPVADLPAELVEQGERFYDISEMEIYVVPAGGLIAEFSGDPIEWPLDTPLNEIGMPLDEAVGGEQFSEMFPDTRTDVLTGTDLDAVLPLAEGANLYSPWESNGDLYAVLFRPLLPGEVGGLARLAQADEASADEASADEASAEEATPNA